MAVELEKQSVKWEFEHKVGNTFLVDIIASFVLLFEEAVWPHGEEFIIWFDFCMTPSFSKKVFEHTWWESAETCCPYFLFIIDTKLISSLGKWRWGKWDGRLRSGSAKVSNFIQRFLEPILHHLHPPPGGVHLEIMTFWTFCLRLEHEVVSDSLVTTFASNPSVLCLEPGFHLGKKPR